MEPPDFEATNLTVAHSEETQPVCEEWRAGAEGAVFHLANVLVFLGLMGGSGFYGLLYLFAFLTSGFLCLAVWAWSDPCTSDSFLWNLALLGACAAQVALVARRLRRSVSFESDFHDLYRCLFQKLGVSPALFGKIVACCDGGVHTLEKEQYFAVEGKTAIDKLSLLLSGR